MRSSLWPNRRKLGGPISYPLFNKAHFGGHLSLHRSGSPDPPDYVAWPLVIKKDFLDVRFSKKSPDDGAAKGDEYAFEGNENQSNSRGAGEGGISQQAKGLKSAFIKPISKASRPGWARLTNIIESKALLMFQKSRVGQVDRWSQSLSPYKSRGGGGGNASFSIVRPGPYA